MPLTSVSAIVGPARERGLGVGALNVIGIEHAEGIVTGAEAAGLPVVLQISENCVAYHGGLAPIARGAAWPSRAPPGSLCALVHLDHASSRELVEEAGLGLGSVMYDDVRPAVRGQRAGHRRHRALVP